MEKHNLTVTADELAALTFWIGAIGIGEAEHQLKTHGLNNVSIMSLFPKLATKSVKVGNPESPRLKGAFHWRSY